MSDWSDAYRNTEEAQADGYVLVQPFAYIMLSCPRCWAMIPLTKWREHNQYHDPRRYMPIVCLSVDEKEEGGRENAGTETE